MAYIPTTDAALDNWALNFSTKITANFAEYGLLAADAGIIAGQYAIWHAAYLLAIDPGTRTKLAVADKDGEKVTLLQIVRQYAAQIRANAGITDEQLADLGLNIPDPTPTPIPVPTTSPKLSILLAGIGSHQISMVDSLTPTKKAKPYGVVGALLYGKSGDTYNIDMTDAPLLSVVTRSDYVCDVSGVPAGQWMVYRARWFNAKGQFGPYSTRAAFVVTGEAPPEEP